MRGLTLFVLSLSLASFAHAQPEIQARIDSLRQSLKDHPITAAEIFYLGEAQGEAEFARFCAGLNLPRKGRAIALRSLLPELLALQEKTNAAFQPPRSIDQHPRFIALNSTLKLARELDAAKLY